MSVDFLDAFNRHAKDAKRLYDGERWANADHLFGLAAECGLKRLMVAFGMTTRGDAPDNQEDKVHANKLWPRYESYRSGHPDGTGYELPAPDPFADWNINQRYDHQSGFTQSRVDAHKAGMDAVANLINKATRDGWI